MNLKLITFDNVAHAEVQGYPLLDANLKTSLCYIRHCFKTHFLKEFGIPYSCVQLTLNTYMPNNSLFLFENTCKGCLLSIKCACLS